MSRAIIIANGEILNLDAARAVISPDDFVIAADGGLRHCFRLGLTPRLLIGDLDSTSPADLATLEATGTQIIRHPAHKDQTDLELAIEWAIRNGHNDILVLGALGDRWDQTLANLLLPALYAQEGTRIRIIDGRQQISLARGPGSLTLSGAPGDTVSLIPIGGDAHGVTTSGLEYPLDNGTLRFGSTLGISNTLTAREAIISVQEGLLVCVLFFSTD